MKSELPVTSIVLTRQEQLVLWMRRNGWTYKALGQLVSMTGANAARRLNSDTIPPHHHEEWSKVLPVDLLPTAMHLKPGPKPRSEAA